ncbi:small acid-soluble spore protein alpha/beta type [Paenisporosarcina sp. OV554]|nr:small acid-soluble spore protein alpha/beta type [Paenisporosarcina sp. OV554]
MIVARKNKILVPEARQGLDQLKNRVMESQGYGLNSSLSEDVKYEIADELGIPLNREYNGNLTSKQAGTIGGPIGGNMVKEMIKLAQEQLARK